MWLSSLIACLFPIFCSCCSVASTTSDPYLWLEDSNSVAQQDWLAEQKTRFKEYQQSNPQVQDIKATIQSLVNDDFPKSIVQSGQNYLLHQKNALYIQNRLDGKPELLLDIDKINGDSSFTLVGYVPSPNGQLVAYGLSENGSDWISWNILHIATKQSYSESTGKTKFSAVCWSPDSLGFYYSYYDDQLGHGVYYHRLGTTQAQDQLVYRDLKNKNYFYIPRSSSDRRYLLIDIITGSMAPNSFLCLDLEHLYPNNLKIWEFGKEAAQNSCSGASGFALEQSASEAAESTKKSGGLFCRRAGELGEPARRENFAAKLTPPKPKFSSCLGIDSPITDLIPFDGGTYWFVCNRGSKFYFTTTKDAPFRKLIVVDIQNPTIRQDVISEKTDLLADIFPIGNCFLVSYLEDVCSKLSLFDCNGHEIRKIPLPDFGIVEFLHGHPDSNGTRDFLEKEAAVLFSFNNIVRPHTLYKFSLDLNEPSVFRKSNIDVDSNDYFIRQIFYPTKDGTKVPMFIVHKKDLVMDGKTPTMLYGYGGFSIPNLPTYNSMRMAWLQQGGIVASASVRGGGEYGVKWHHAGVKEKKQNSIDDLVAAAEWLIDNEYTNPTKLSLYGFSNGAMVAAACANQKPGLFGAIVANGGIYDMIRYPLFSLGKFWLLEYGNPDNPRERDFIEKYSPYHNIKVGTHYPSMLIVTSEQDDRVVPLHSYKYTAALQKAQAGEGEILLRVTPKGGHFANDIDVSTDILAFITKELGKDY